MRAIGLASMVIVAFAVGKLEAAVIWDYSPATTGAAIGGLFSNEASGQNFAERIIFSELTLVTGMDIYTRFNFASVGQSATIRLRNDSSGAPGALLAQFVEAISIVDTQGAVGSGMVRAHIDFTAPLTLSAATPYWIGMSGTSTQLAQFGLSAPDDSRMFQFSGTSHQGFVQTGDMAFRLHGPDAAAVPEPTSLALFGLGAIGIALSARRRRR